MQTNRAHALMFLGHPNEPREIYLKFRGKKSHGNKIWEDDVKDDFAELRKHGLSHPLMDQIERTFNGSSAVSMIGFTPKSGEIIYCGVSAS